MLEKATFQPLHAVCRNVRVAHVLVGALVPVASYPILIGRRYKMSASKNQYAQLFGIILTEAPSMARCACVTCNSCTCSCSCRNTPDTDNTVEDFDW